MNIGIVIIGRNEGQRLKNCLSSLLTEIGSQNEHHFRLVYVDSGSTDGSLEFVQTLGIEIVNLDLREKFTAARARNAGAEKLLALNPHLEYIQFIDGDCQIVSGWLNIAGETLKTHPQIAVVCGRRCELFPDKSIYNLLCNLEWNTPIGEAKACGGDAMMRVKAFQEVGGFNPLLIAGEEPELCLRLRQQGWQIWRIDHDMTLHDANMTQFSQWWKRNFRAGFAFAEGSWLHGKSEEKHWVKESRSIWLWGLVIPLVAIALIIPSRGWSLSCVFLYPLLGYKIYVYQKRQGYQRKEAFWYSFFCVLGKFPQLLGQLNFQRLRLLKQQASLVEYKSNSNQTITD
jgi:GT2 family glycosyltransferase